MLSDNRLLRVALLQAVAAGFSPAPPLAPYTQLHGKWVCSYCHQLFTAKGTVATHIRVVHMNEKNFACDFCGKKFSKRFNKTQHEKKCQSRPVT